MKYYKGQLDVTGKGKYELKTTIPAQQYEEYIKNWQKRLPEGWCTIYTAGESGGYPIWVAEFTNPNVKREEKEIAMVIAQHSLELSGTNTVFSVGNFLAHGDDLAKEIMTKQVVVVVPSFNMFSLSKMDIKYQFKNQAGIDEYQPFDKDWNIDKEKAPAGYALKTLIDKLKPELILDVHGTWFVGGGCFESTGGFSHANLNYSYDVGFVKAMNASAEEHGFAIFDEDVMQSLRPVDPICYEGNNRALFRKGRPSMLMAVYAYLRYHTFFLNFEACYEESSFYRVIEALRLGCHPIAPINGAGYPVQCLRSFIFSGSLMCGGKNAKQRRESRVEIWQNLHKIGTGAVGTELHGLQTLFIVNNHKKMYESYGKPFYKITMQEAYEVFEKMGCKTERIKELFKEYENYVDFYYFGTGTDGDIDSVANITKGMTLRIAIPHSDAILQEVLLNGETVSESQCKLLCHKNFTYVDVMIDGNVGDMASLVVKYDYKPRMVGIIEFD